VKKYKTEAGIDEEPGGSTWNATGFPWRLRRSSLTGRPRRREGTALEAHRVEPLLPHHELRKRLAHRGAPSEGRATAAETAARGLPSPCRQTPSHHQTPGPARDGSRGSNRTGQSSTSAFFSSPGRPCPSAERPRREEARPRNRATLARLHPRPRYPFPAHRHLRDRKAPVPDPGSSRPSWETTAPSRTLRPTTASTKAPFHWKRWQARVQNLLHPGSREGTLPFVCRRVEAAGQKLEHRVPLAAPRMRSATDEGPRKRSSSRGLTRAAPGNAIAGAPRGRGRLGRRPTGPCSFVFPVVLDVFQS